MRASTLRLAMVIVVAYLVVAPLPAAAGGASGGGAATANPFLSGVLQKWPLVVDFILSAIMGEYHGPTQLGKKALDVGQTFTDLGVQDAEALKGLDRATLDAFIDDSAIGKQFPAKDVPVAARGVIQSIGGSPVLQNRIQDEIIKRVYERGMTLK